MEFTGRRLGRYQLVRLLGFGGMGEVYLAQSLGVAGFEKLVTVKILRRHVSGNADRVRDLLKEAFIGVRLDHENIVQVLDLCEHDGMYFFVMEYVRGFSLRELIAFTSEPAEPIPIRPIAHVIRCIAGALEYVHRVRGPGRKPLGLIHRDVSPSNILLGAEGRIKLSDFGVSMVAQDPMRAGAVIGKPRYLPPEAARCEPATQAWDVYALGVVLHACLSGDTDDTGGSVIGPQLRSLSEARPDCPQSLVDLVERATARDPATRLGDATSFRQLLDEAVPRQADDAEVWHQFVQSVYRREQFITRYGVLPHVEDLASEITSAPQATTSVAYVETVVIDAEKPLRFGLSPALGVAVARAQGDRVAAWLRARIERDVRTVVVADYKALVEALVDGTVDIAWMPPAVFVTAAERGAGIVTLAERYGRPTYESAIIVRADSELHGIADLKGKSIAFVDRDSASGYLYAANRISRELGRLDDALREQHFQGSHKAVCDAVLRGWVDAGATYAVRDRAGQVAHSGWLDLPEADRAKFRPIAFTDQIPGDNIAHRPGLAAGLIDRLARTLTDLKPHDTEGRAIFAEVFHITGMVCADVRLYDSVREILRRGSIKASA